MKSFIVNIFVLFFISVVIWSITNYSYQKKFDSLELEKNSCLKQKRTIEEKRPILTMKDVSFANNRDKELETITKSQLYFDTKVQKLTDNQWKITIKLAGNVEGAADAADFKINIPIGLTVSDLKTGIAFPLYPRKVITENYLLVTGLASTVDNKLVFGKPNSVFAEFMAEATDGQLNKKPIPINDQETKVYLNGESVLDAAKSVSQINLPWAYEK